MSALNRTAGPTRRWMIAGFVVVYAAAAVGVAMLSARSAKSYYSAPAAESAAASGPVSRVDASGVDASGVDGAASRPPRSAEITPAGPATGPAAASPATGPTPAASQSAPAAAAPAGETPTVPLAAPTSAPRARALGAPPVTPQPAAADPAAQAGPPGRAAAGAVKPGAVTQGVVTPGVVTMPASVNLARGRPVNVTSHTEIYVGQQATDGDVNSYWEGQAGFPQTLRVDLGSVTTVGRLSLSLPPVADWNRRVQTLSVHGSRDGASFTRLTGPTAYVFDANSAAHNSVVVSLSSSAQRYLELRFTANDGWKAAQLSELQVWSS